MVIGINWSRLARAIEFYQGSGYRLVEVPWIASMPAMMITAPSEESVVKVSGQEGLIGSAEQGFLELALNGALPPGKYVACSPCFRNEAVYDEIHLRSFMKVELFRNDIVSHSTLGSMVDTALSFFQSALPDGGHFDVVMSPEDVDINLGGIEIGSYGLRETQGLRWVYGTGLAEPRFGMAKERAISLVAGRS